ncbi:MAG: hypothetical protein JF614_21815 [Acidobacteria bacterium]|nr:hypothetical protein [Acidobacteriota bacterium]
MKRLILLLAAFTLVVLAAAAPVIARPPLCSCPFCASTNAPCSYNPGTGFVTLSCGTYFGTYCTHPN